MEKIKIFIKNVAKKYQLLFFSLLFIFFGSYLIAEGLNYLNAKYECSFTTQQSISSKDILNLDALITTRDSAEKYSEINVEKLLENKDIYLETHENNNYTLVTYARYYENFFIKNSSSVSTRAKKFIEDHLIYTLGQENISFTNENIIVQSHKLNSYIFSGIITGIIFIPLTIIVGVQKEENQVNNFYDNKETFKTPFYQNYWKKASSFFSSAKNLTLIAMLFAMMMVSKMIILPSGFGNLGLSFGYLFFSIIALIYGPLAGLLIGFLSDILGFFLFDTSGTGFFIGYVIQAMITGFIYGISLYRVKLSFKRIFISRLLISLISNIIIGSICWGIVANYNFQQTLSYMLLLSLPKNIIFLIPQSILLFIVIKAISPLLAKFKYIEPKIANNITLF